jgi:two-component system, OmpR family, response regulator TctD
VPAVKVLLIEDDQAMRTTLQRSFERCGARVVVCERGDRAVARWQASQPDVVVLDLSLPGRDGLDVLRDARRQGLPTPVLILTARSTVGDRVLGLDLGADDYLAKPFDLDELDARVRALARRHVGSEGLPEEGSSYCGLRCDAGHGAIYLDGKVLDLAPREAALLRALLAHPGKALAKERLFAQIFAGETGVHIEAVEVVAYRLRRKLAGAPVQLVTLRGLGYLLQAA